MDNKELSESIKKTFYDLSFGKGLGKADFSINNDDMTEEQRDYKLKQFKELLHQAINDPAPLRLLVGPLFAMEAEF